MQGMEQNRNKGLDLLKGVATILVVYVHAANIYAYANVDNMAIRFLEVFSALGVPIFFCVSGYLITSKYCLGKYTYVDDIRRKTMNLLVPLLLWNTFYYILEKLMEGDLKFDLREILLQIIGIPFITSPVYAPLWFVRDLFVLSLLYPFIRRITKAVPVCVIGCLLVWFLSLPNYFRQAFVWYTAGVMLFDYKDVLKAYPPKICFDKLYKPLLLALLCVQIVNAYLTFEAISRILILFYTFAMWTFAMQFLPVSIANKGIYRFLGKDILKASFLIYVLHGKVLSILQIIWVRVFEPGGFVLLVGYFVLPVIVISLCMLAHRFVSRFPFCAILTGNRS